MPVLLLFDIDGTLVLTGGAGGRAMTRAFVDVFGVADAFQGVPMPGRTDPLIVAEAAQRAGLEPDASALSTFQRRYSEVLREEIVRPGPRKGVLPGVRGLLDALQDFPAAHLALLTGNYTDAARIKLEYFDLWRYFACGAYGEEAPDRNQLVAVAIDRARACGVPGSALDRIIVVGDTPLDVACARSAGAFALAVATGGHSVCELASSGANVVLEDLSDTAQVLHAIESAFQTPAGGASGRR